ncbi:type III secretion system inner membrane ring subunit SctD [Acanthopleuribacter pedis]|uniref:Type III secretion system inner membrane ring subunit SctD n=1 Tax=Acanthopleuribacter pedis TaxID=442870 RepID=A0A8J7U8V6_9BACT|nr:type III secretion system inner membrane ring subunit SctD [Acanthopleuribacter pedis]MBO1322986.1 type III secretion system inner membrane ring subunit SctD [Acanthopleuribacter pedis]
MSDAQKYLLKILSGPHMGAELQLNPGEVVIGRNLNCDVVLHDSAILDHHVRLDISQDGMTLVLLDGGAFLEGKWLQEPAMPYQFYQVISLGTTHLALGMIDETWPQIVLPTLESIQSQQAVATSEEGEPELETQADKTPEPAATTPTPTGAPGRYRLRLAAAAFAGIAFCLAGLLFVGYGNPSQAAVSQQSNGLGPNASLDQILGHYAFESLQLDRTADGALIIKGAVADAAILAELSGALAPFTAQVHLTVATSDRILEACRQVLRMQGLDLEITATEEQGIVLKGFCADPAKLSATLHALRKDVPGLGLIENKVLTATELTRFLGEKVSELGLGHLVRVGYGDGRMVVEGRLSEHEMNHWQQVRTAFQERYGTPLPIVEKLAPRTDIAVPMHGRGGYGPPQLDVVSISVGRRRYVTLANNRKLFEGAVLENGYILSAIKVDRLILTRNGHRWVLKPGENS